MNDVRLTVSEINLLAELLTEKSVSIIWDINAFYFNASGVTYKLECYEVLPDGSNSQYDELFFCKFSRLPKSLLFKQEKPGYWYKIVAHNAEIQLLEIVEVTQLFPGNQLLDEQDIAVNAAGLNKVCLGLLITTEAGVLPALLLPSNHGFMWLEKYDFYERYEVEKILSEHIKKYRLKKVSATFI